MQAGAGVLAMALFLPPVRRLLPRLSTALLLVTLLAMFAALLLDQGTDGVHRWLSVGPMRLHIGLLLIPAVLTIHARGDSGITAGLALMACAQLMARQPDLGTALAMTIALLPTALIRRDRLDWVPLAMAAVTSAFFFDSPDRLQPVAMVEHVLTDAWQWTAWTGPLALIGALLLPASLLWQARIDAARRLPALALTGLWFGLLLASLIGHYPVPLLGYGASAVIGWGLALALMEAPGVDAKPRV